MKKNNKLLIGLICVFFLLLGATAFVSFSGNIDVEEVVVQSITLVYDENSTIVVDNENVTFNDKNQVVDYKVVIENTQDYDVKITDIKLSTPSEEFLKFEIEEIDKDIVKANSTKELVLSLETTGIKGWGRNFSDVLTANVSFDKVVKQEDVTLPEDDKEEEKQPEAPSTNIEEIINKTKEIKVTSITNNIIEFKEDIKVVEGDKVAVWIYSNPIFLGYFDVVITNGIKQIVGLEEALKKVEIETGEYNIVLVTESKEVIGYINVYINEDKELQKKNPQYTTEKEDVPKDNDTNVENPYTSNKELLVVLVIATSVTGLGIIIVAKNKFTKYTILIIALSSTLPIARAENPIVLPININVSFESQNIMPKPFNIVNKEIMPGVTFPVKEFQYFWAHNGKIRKIYIENELNEITEYAYKYDVSEKQNGRVIAYLVSNEEDNNYFDLYLQADGIIYPNIDASYYFADMRYLTLIDNIEGLDTSNVTNMSYMFSNAGYNSTNFTLDLSNLDTSNVTNMSYMFSSIGYNNPNFILNFSDLDTRNVTDMSGMFSSIGYNSTNFTLDLSGLDTSSVTDMSYMFSNAGYNSTNFALDLSNLDTSNVTDMSGMFSNAGYNSANFVVDFSDLDTSNVTDMSSMFAYVGYNNPNFTLELRGLDTRNVTNMSKMFYYVGYNSTCFTLDVSNFDTSNVTDMSAMFYYTGYNSTNFTLDVSNFDTSKVISMSSMFRYTGYKSTNFTLDVSNFDTSNVTDMSTMFDAVGFNNPNFTLDVSNFDTSNVTDMSYMFQNTGHNSTNFILDLSNFDTSNVTDMGNMFTQTAYNNPNFTLDISNFDTRNVTDMYEMFYRTGYNSTNFTLNLGDKFDTSKVTNMHHMFSGTGHDSTKLNVEITITNPELRYYNDIFYDVATKPGAKITVNYTSATSSLVDKMIATKSSGANVVKGVQVDK